MKILFVITGLGMGGAEKQTCLLADRMVDAGHDVIIISLTGNTVVRPINNISIKELKMGKNIFSFIYTLIRARELIKKFKPDVVHSHMFHANIFSRILRIFTKIPCLVCTAHSTNEGNKARMFIYRLTDKLASITTNVSQEAVQTFIDKGASYPGRIISIPNGIDTDKFKYTTETRLIKRKELNINDNNLMLLSVGRLTEAKDYPNLFKAYAKLCKENYFGRELLFFIVGVGHLQTELETLAEELNIKSSVHFLGIRNDIPDLMCAADIFILSSEWEGFGLVIAEAMACERVVVSTDCGGVKEVIGNCGELVPIKNHIALSDAISRMLTISVEEKTKLGAHARERIIKNNSIDVIMNRWVDIYRGQMN